MDIRLPKAGDFAARNKLPPPIDLWLDILDASGIEDHPTAHADERWMQDKSPWMEWRGGETDFFTESLARPVSGYFEGFARMLKRMKIKTWIELPNLVMAMRVVPGLEGLQLPKTCLDLIEERDAKASEEVGDHKEGTGVEAEDWRQCAGTPKEIFKVLHDEYGFDIDICAAPFNAVLPEYLTRDDDALSMEWLGRVYCNPPYQDIPSWLIHAHEAEFTVFLLPVRADRGWWREYKPQAECHYFVGEAPHRRLQFIPPPGITYSSNPGSHCLFIFGQGATPGKEVWRSGKTGERL